MACFTRVVFCGFFLYAIHGFSAFPFPGAEPYTTLFPIDPAQRGQDIIQMFKTLSGPPYKKTTSEIAVVTTLNGFIPFINAVTAAHAGTMLVFSYRTAPGGTTAQNIYVAIPVEQVHEMIYSDTTITNTNFTSTIPKREIPYYSVNMSQRASDIQGVVSAFHTLKPFKTTVERVTIQTTLNGLLYYAPFTNGLIPDVQTVSLSASSHGTLMIVTYQISNINYYIVVSPEQVISINYCPRDCS